MRNLPLIVICYLFIYIVWGSTYYFIKVAVESIPPLSVIGFRFFCGGILFLFASILMRRVRRLPTASEWFKSMFMATLLLIGGNGLVTIAERKVDSYVAALCVASTPVVVAIFNLLFFGKKPGIASVVGIFVGITGVGFLLYNGHSIASSFTPSIVLVMCAVIFWSFATVMGHTIKPYPDIFVSSAMQMVFAGVICLILASIPALAQQIPSHSNVPTLSSILSLAYLATIASLAFAAYNYLLIHEPAQRVSSYALINPLIAVLFGILIGHEQIVMFLIPGLVCILVGVGLIMYGDDLIVRFFRPRI